MTEPSFRRYTRLAATIHLLRTKTITLLNPATWDDTNDAYFMAEYKRLRGAESVLALCFADREETYHHWRIFSHGADGICFTFDKDSVLSVFNGDTKVRHGSVKYEEVKAVQKMKSVEVDRLPFLKRYPYHDEREYRIVYTDPHDAMESKSYPIAVSWIERITLSPWMPKALATSVREALKSIDGCSRIKVYQSTLVDNENWKALTARAGIGGP